MADSVTHVLTVFIAITIAAIGFGFLTGSPTRARSVAVFFYWTLPSLIVIRVFRALVAFFRELVRR